MSEERIHPILVEAKGIILLIIGYEFSNKKHAVTHAGNLNTPLFFTLKTCAKTNTTLKYTHALSQDHVFGRLLLKA